MKLDDRNSVGSLVRGIILKQKLTRRQEIKFSEKLHKHLH